MTVSWQSNNLNIDDIKPTNKQTSLGYLKYISHIFINKFGVQAVDQDHRRLTILCNFVQNTDQDVLISSPIKTLIDRVQK